MELQKTGVRKRLKPRREPYWRPLDTGFALGFRKMESGSETWVARLKVSGKQKYQKLGPVSPVNDYSTAVEKAQVWRVQRESGVGAATVTVWDACEAYIRNRELMKGETAAVDARKRLSAHIERKPIGAVRLDKLKPEALQAWLEALVTVERRSKLGKSLGIPSKSSANRNLRTLKAALNLAYRNGAVASNVAWRGIDEFAEGDNSRDTFLDAELRQKIFAVAPDRLRLLLMGILYTGARVGELTKLTVSDYDPAVRSVRFTTRKGKGGKLRARDFPLSSEQAYKLFQSLSMGKTPSAPLFEYRPGEHWPTNGPSWEFRRSVRSKLPLPDDVVPYSFRHSAIAEWLAAGIPVNTVAHMTGTSVARIESNYRKWIRSSVEDQLAQISL